MELARDPALHPPEVGKTGNEIREAMQVFIPGAIASYSPRDLYVIEVGLGEKKGCCTHVHMC